MGISLLTDIPFFSFCRKIRIFSHEDLFGGNLSYILIKLSLFEDFCQAYAPEAPS